MAAVGIFGGTFDPVHFGHLITARALCEKRDLQKIIFVPCFISPHKTEAESASPIHRLNMLKLAIEGDAKFEFSDYEIGRKKISYSYSTIKHFKKNYDDLELIIGYDNLVKFDTWHKPDKILELAKLIVMKRNIDFDSEFNHEYDKDAVFVDTPAIEISSTDIRNRVKLNKSINYLVPEKVNEYINKMKLYKE